MLIVGCPVKGDQESLIEMLRSLYQSTSVFDKLILATPDDLDIKGERLEVIKDDFKSPIEAYNRLFSEAIKLKSDLLLTQTDVIFPKLYKRDWLGIMKTVAKDPNVSIVTCVNGGGLSGEDYIQGFRWVGGWCTYIPYHSLIKLKEFDTKFPNGYGVDIDLTYRAIKLGKIVAMDYWVDHHQMNERDHDNDPNTEQMKQNASKYFKEKWKDELDR